MVFSSLGRYLDLRIIPFEGGEHCADRQESNPGHMAEAIKECFYNPYPIAAVDAAEVAGAEISCPRHTSNNNT